jgi:hypothetical protein
MQLSTDAPHVAASCTLAVDGCYIRNFCHRDFLIANLGYEHMGDLDQ